MKQIKLCKDCRFFNANAFSTENCDKHVTISRVTGKRVYTHRNMAHCMRSDDWFIALFMGTCGKMARWFEPKV